MSEPWTQPRPDPPSGRASAPRSDLLGAAPIFLLLVGLAASAWVFTLGRRERLRAEEAALASLATNAQQGIAQRMTTYVDALRGAVGLVRAMPSLDRATWGAFADSLDLTGRYPGINGIGLIYPVPAAAKDTFLRRVRGDGAPAFSIHPVPEAAAEGDGTSFVITYLAPLAGNEPALGLDLGSERARREAAEASRDSGQPRITGRISLVQDRAHGPGFLLYLPVYRAGAPVASIDERRAALQAWVYAPFVTERFLQGVLGKRSRKLGLFLFEQEELDAAHLLYTSRPSDEGLPVLTRVTHLELAGRRFTLGWTRGPDFTPEPPSPLLGAALGLAVVTLLLAALVHGLQTFRARAERLVADRTAELLASEHRWKFALEGSGDGLWDRDVPAGLVSLNRRSQEMLGLAGDAIGVRDWEKRIHPEDEARVLDLLRSHLEGRSPLYLDEHRVRCEDGSWKWVLERGLVVSRDDAGGPLRVIGTQQDITARKQAEADLQASLRDKEALVKEVHHRVKNNLQVITSLLGLEARRRPHPATKSVLRDMQGRVQSMAVLHESLYRSDNLAAVDLAVYLESVVKGLTRAQAAQPDLVRLHLELAPVRVEIDQAIPCGLMVNELVSNCFKHAFPQGSGGEVRVELRELDPGSRVRLRVSDTGAGLPADFASRWASSLGLQLVSDLAGQVGGRLEIGPGPEAVFDVTFTPSPSAPARRASH